MNDHHLTHFIELKLIEIGRAMMEYYDCCHLDGDSCKAGQPNLCCYHTVFGGDLCPHRIDGECANVNSDCTLWLCKTAIQSTDPKCVEGLKLLEQFGMLYGLVRKPLIGQPYSGADKNKR